ncbi:MAG TPA: signal recognition particle-docking protein FtsY [Patescibacteria group bacterium]|jgi:fused signal recognition particle receptor|nr:signal recognition particle-docking protein FtsY [Patescibacteria group bacterium]
MFSFIKSSLQGIYNQFTSKISNFFSFKIIDETVLTELERILIVSDVGIKTTKHIMERLRAQHIQTGQALHGALHDILCNMVIQVPTLNIHRSPSVFLMVGVNGSGKTTSIGKLAYWWAQQEKKVLIVAADTFRAAAVAQIEEWSKKSSVDFFSGSASKDPAAVVHEGCEKFLRGNYDILLIDTAGRLQTKTPLMNELSKIKRVINKKLEVIPVFTLLTLDSMLGQNSFEQARLFKEATDLSGIILTKMDGTGKGGIIFSVLTELGIPVLYITYGEQIKDIAVFDGQKYVQELLQKV